MMTRWSCLKNNLIIFLDGIIFILNSGGQIETDEVYIHTYPTIVLTPLRL
jgi:hypothetical protein